MPGLLNFPMEKVMEGSAEIFAPTAKIVSKKLPVFYNPAMKFNRDITILLLSQFPKMSLCDPLAGTGIISIRFAKELKFKSITANDASKRAFLLIKKNMNHNNVKFFVHNKDANVLLLESEGFDFIDLDVFGSPNFVLDSAAKRLSREGILAVTATDTAALCGASPKACIRKYWAVPEKNSFMHETGLRILIRKVQLVAAQYDKALYPIFSYFKDHYFRAFFMCKKGKGFADYILAMHKTGNNSGPYWAGKLFDTKLAGKMNESAYKDKIFGKNSSLLRFLDMAYSESSINSAGFYDIHYICSKNSINPVPKKETILFKIRKKGYKASSTHFKGTGIRSDISYDELVKIIKNK